MKREAFNKTLIEQPVVRHRLAKCGAMLETQQAWIEQFAYAMTKLTKAEADQKLGGLTALAKANGGMVIAACAECATLLFGGNGYTKSGQGERIESKKPSKTMPQTDSILTFLCRNIPRSYGRAYSRWIRGCHA
jgi:acyl-CoA dehydrogenase